MFLITIINVLMNCFSITICNYRFLPSCATPLADLRWLWAANDPWSRCCKGNTSSRRIVPEFEAGSWPRPEESWRRRRGETRRRTRPSVGRLWCCAHRETFLTNFLLLVVISQNCFLIFTLTFIILFIDVCLHVCLLKCQYYNELRL